MAAFFQLVLLPRLFFQFGGYTVKIAVFLCTLGFVLALLAFAELPEVYKFSHGSEIYCFLRNWSNETTSAPPFGALLSPSSAVSSGFFGLDASLSALVISRDWAT